MPHRMAPFLEPLQQPVRAALEQLIEEMQLIAERSGGPVPPPQHLVLSVQDGTLVGSGWHEIESDGASAWRWSGLEGPCSTLELPDPGRGNLRFSFRLVMPFGASLDPDAVHVVVNATPLRLRPGAGGTTERPVLVGDLLVPEDRPAGPFSCVLILPRYTDPAAAGGGVGDTRRLGPGLLGLAIRPAEIEAPVLHEAAAEVPPAAE
jgi:hypothetical protein